MGFDGLHEIYELLQARLVVDCWILPMFSCSWTFSRAGEAANVAAEGLEPRIFEFAGFVGEGYDFIIPHTPAFASDFEAVLIFEDDKSDLPRVIAIPVIDVLVKLRPILR